MDGLGLLGPGQPVLNVRSQVDGPETVQEGRVHLVHSVGTTGVDGREYAGVLVELPAVELTIQNDLECRLHDLWGGAVEFVKEKTDWLVACQFIPLRWIESGDLAVSARETNHIAFGHLAESAVDYLEVLDAFIGGDDVRDLTDDLALADAVASAEEDRSRLR